MDINFNTEVNISYIDETLPKPGFKLVLKHYLSSILIYSIIVFLIKQLPFFTEIVNYKLVSYYVKFLLLYIFAAPIFLLWLRPMSLHKSHSVEIVTYFVDLWKRFEKEKIGDLQSLIYIFQPTYYQQQAFALMFVKVFFGTLMITGLLNNINIITERMPEYSKFFWHIVYFPENLLSFLGYKSNFVFRNLILFLFSLDLLVFSIGYFTELGVLDNKIRSIDTSFAGLFFCLLCYPPFNQVSGKFLAWFQSENYTVYGNSTHILTIIFRCCAIFFLVIYVWASVALGFKASNLTNRGTVSVFPYNIVRHPAYLSKILFWFFTTIPMFFTYKSLDFSKVIFICISMFCWAGVYYIRALTEERHLLKDPEYQQYTEKVKYRFIPKVY